MGYRKPKEFRKDMKHWNVTIASGDVKFERKLARMARDKENRSEPEEMYKKIYISSFIFFIYALIYK